jgi:transposase-like protein
MPFAKENATLLTFLRCLAEGKDRRSTAAACGKSVSMVTAWISKLRKTIPQQHRIVTGEPPSISLTCPHCGKTGKKQRKGWNIGQRWRCTACMRTFLDPGVYTCPVCGGGKENTVPLERNEGEPHLRFCKACKSTYVLPSEAEQRRMLEEGRLAPDQRDGLAKVAGMILESLNAGTGVEAAMKNAGIDLAPWSIDRCRLPLPTPGGTWPTRQGDVPGQP